MTHILNMPRTMHQLYLSSSQKKITTKFESIKYKHLLGKCHFKLDIYISDNKSCYALVDTMNLLSSFIFHVAISQRRNSWRNTILL